MNLNEFIKTVLVDISNGVKEAKDSLFESEHKVCPPLKPFEVLEIGAKLSKDGIYYQQVEFDVAVTVENKNDGGGKAGVKVCGLEASIGGNASTNNISVNRIKFHVPIGLSSK